MDHSLTRSVVLIFPSTLQCYFNIFDDNERYSGTLFYVASHCNNIVDKCSSAPGLIVLIKKSELEPRPILSLSLFLSLSLSSFDGSTHHQRTIPILRPTYISVSRSSSYLLSASNMPPPPPSQDISGYLQRPFQLLAGMLTRADISKVISGRRGQSSITRVCFISAKASCTSDI